MAVKVKAARFLRFEGLKHAAKKIMLKTWKSSARGGGKGWWQGVVARGAGYPGKKKNKKTKNIEILQNTMPMIYTANHFLKLFFLAPLSDLSLNWLEQQSSRVAQ